MNQFSSTTIFLDINRTTVRARHKDVSSMYLWDFLQFLINEESTEFGICLPFSGSHPLCCTQGIELSLVWRFGGIYQTNGKPVNYR